MTKPNHPPTVHLPWWRWSVPCIWAGAFLTGKAALDELSPDTVTFVRFAITVLGGAVVLRPSIVETFAARPDRWQWGAIALLALTGGVAYHVTFYAGLARTQPPIASVVIATNPILTTLGAVVFLRDRRSIVALFIGLTLAFTGSVLLAMDKPFPGIAALGPDGASLGLVDRLVNGWGLGETLCLIASFSWAVFAVLMQHFRAGLLANLPGTGVTFLVYALTALALLPIVITSGGIRAIPDMSPAAWGCMLYLGLLATVFAYTVYNAGLDRVGSSRVSQVTYAVPALATLLTIALVPSFDPSWRTWIGLAFVTCGLIVSDGRLWQRVMRN